MAVLMKRPRWWDGALWWRTYREGGFDGWRTVSGRRMACDTMFAALTAPHLHGEIARLTARRTA